MTIYQELLTAREELGATLDERKLCGEKYAAVAAKYESVKARNVLDMKAQGYAATVIELVIKGMPEVNDAFYARELARVEYENASEALQILKRHYDFLRDEYKREWTQAGSDY